MGWRIRVVHTTGYTYEKPVRESYNEARLTPVSYTHLTLPTTPYV